MTVAAALLAQALGLACLLLAPPAHGQPPPAPPTCPSGTLNCRAQGFFSQADFAACLASSVPRAKAVVFPGDPAYDYARRTSISRFDPYPAAVVYAQRTQEVAAAVQCAHRWGVKVSAAGGRHNYQGLAVMTGALVVDLSNMTMVEVEVKENGQVIARVGPGNTNALLMMGITSKGPPGAATVMGDCPSVGVTGFTLGGGFGTMARNFGLSCDRLTGLDVVLANGTVARVGPRNQYADIFWAACGSGGGFGIVTELRMNVPVLADPNHLTKLSVTFNFFNTSALVEAMVRLQRWMPTADQRFGGGGAATGIGLSFAGKASEAVALLKASGLLDPALLNPIVPSSPPSVAVEVPYGLVVKEFSSYRDFMLEKACLYTQKTYSAGFVELYGPDFDCTSKAQLAPMAADLANPRHPMNVGIHPMWRLWTISQCRMLTRPIPANGWLEMLGAAVPDVPDGNCDPAAGADFSNLDVVHTCIAATLIPVWGLNHFVASPVVSRVPRNGTAYPHRNAWAAICFETGFPIQEAELPSVMVDGAVVGLPGVMISPSGLMHAVLARIERFLTALDPYLEPTHPSYHNYMVPALSNWQRAYFGGNYERLTQVMRRYDPLGMFQKPFTPQTGY